MPKSYLILFILFLFFSACQKRTSQSLSDGVLFRIDNQPVLAEEFIYLYEKNNFNNDSIYAQEDIREYLDLFVNFKLKVKAAYEEGIDTTQSFQNEFNTYKAELIKPYLLETRETDSLAKETYKRLQIFIHASHILIRVNDFNNPEDTAEAHSKITTVRKKALAGEDFGALARQFSEDPSASKNSGNLGFFSALKMVYPFENAAYKTPVGEISEIVKTQFGYHIIKVHEKAPNRGRVRIAHIMVNAEEDSVTAKDKIFEIYEKAVLDGDWNYLTLQFSDDERTRSNGGELGFISQGQLPPEFAQFEEAAYLLDSVGQISEPVKSPYGWHILKLLGRQEPQTYEEQKEELKRQVTRGERAAVNKEKVIERLKKGGNLIENKEIFTQLYSYADSTLVQGKWTNSVPDSIQKKTLFLLNRQTVPVSEFMNFISSNQKKISSASPDTYLDQLYRSFMEEKLYKYEEQEIATRHLDYRMLEKEYREGLLLFEVMEKHVWNKSMEDTAGMREFYEENKNRYKWKERVEAVLVKTDREDLVEKIRDELKKEKIVYFTIEMGATLDNTRSNSLLKKAAQLAKKYPLTNFVFEYDSNEVSSGEIGRLADLLSKEGIQKGDISVNHNPGKGVFLKLQSESKKALEEVFNEASALTLQVEEGVFERGENEIIDKLNWNQGIFDLVHEDRFIVVKIDSVLPEGPKKLNEIRGRVISDFQHQLEQDWISELKMKYEVTINDDVLNKIYKYFENK